MTVPFADNSEFHEAISLLIDLQIAICGDDEDRADALRDALDIPLRQLSWEANEWLRGLSGDLEMLCDQEVFEPSDLTQDQYQHKLAEGLQNIQSDPEAILALLRKQQNKLPFDVLAYFRGQAYQHLRLYHVAVTFLRHAIGLNSEPIEYKATLMGCFWSLRDLEQAKLLAKMIVQDFNGNYKAFFLAAGILLHISKKLSPEDRVAFGMLRRQIAEITHSLSPTGSHRILVGFGFTLLGEIAELLNRKSQAMANYSEACILTPTASAPFLLRGRLMLEDDEQKALFDFRRTVDLEASDPLPYLVLARAFLQEGEYDNCTAMCTSAIQIGGPLVQGQAYEFMAIAETQAHGETDLAQHYFDEARRLFPSDSNIQKNQSLFVQARQQHMKKHSSFRSEDMEYHFDLQAVDVTVRNASETEQDDLLDLMLRPRSKQLWPEVNSINAPSNARLSIAA